MYHPSALLIGLSPNERRWEIHSYTPNTPFYIYLKHHGDSDNLRTEILSFRHMIIPLTHVITHRPSFIIADVKLYIFLRHLISINLFLIAQFYILG